MSLDDEALFVADAGSLFPRGRSFGWNLVSTRITQFAYFDQLLGHPIWRGHKILDFGGNVGTFLVGAGDSVDHEDYWCVDLNAAVIEQGRRIYPRAHFIHYNRYSSQYNPDGIRYLPVPDLGVKFDFILAFSVFTHADRGEMIELVESLRVRLAPGGVLAFTFVDPYYNRSQNDPSLPSVGSIYPYAVSRRVDVNGRPAHWYVMIDGELYVEPGDEIGHQKRQGKPLEAYSSYFTVEYIKSLFCGAEVLAPVSPEWQHCCVIRQSQLH